MKKSHLFIIILSMVIITFLLLFSSVIFELKYVEVRFINNYGQEINLADNKIYTTKTKLNEVISSTHFDYGKLMFLINKDEYASELERKNPYIKVVSIEAIFPNKLIINAKERQPVFYFELNDKFYLLDEDFKILNIVSNNLSNPLICFDFINQNEIKTDFFSFFNLSSKIYTVGDFVSYNNLIFSSMLDFYTILDTLLDRDFLLNISNLTLSNKGNDSINLTIKTISPYGIELEISDLTNNFNDKFKKIINAFKTLLNKEKVKTTYGKLLIDKNNNCFWYE